MDTLVVNPHGRSSIPGLWACGEVAYTVMYGANRPVGNLLLEAVGCAAVRAQAKPRYVPVT